MNVFDRIADFEYKSGTGLFNMTSGFFALVLEKLFKKEDRAILVVTSSSFEARKLYNKFCDSSNIIFFENDEMVLKDGNAISPELRIDRINVLNELVDNGKKIVFTDVSGYLKYLPTVSDFSNSNIFLKEGSVCDRDEIVSRLVEFGYTRDSMVSKMGDFALRGFILDVFPVNADEAIRIEFFGDTIESIRYFDINNQRSISNVKEFNILPYVEIDYEKYVNISSYLDNPIVIFKDIEQIRFTYNKMVSDDFYYNGDSNKKFFDFDDIALSDYLYYFDLDNYLDVVDTCYDFSVSSVPKFNENLTEINNFVKKCIDINKTVIIFVSISNFDYFLDMIDFPYVITNKNEVFSGKVNIVRDKLSEGFEVSDLVVLTDYELFNKNNIVYKKTRFKNSSRIKDLSKINVGDYVVHDLYGIGVYNGIKVLKKSGIVSDYLEVLYAKGDKLYIPASKMELISKYTGKEGFRPVINALNSSLWQKTKSRVKEKIKYESERLLKVQAERQMKKGFAFSKDHPLQILFEEEFDYEETSDQIKAIREIKEDMESVVPMDRILCGDVGYGKTEVAFRAMFKAVLDNKQVLYLCPTTLLSKQQYEVALERFKSFPVNIALLNRFVSDSDAKKILMDLKDGKIDILFGTHRILSDDVVCSDLGLLVIDEEQRFGVVHKEKIKEMKANIDVLTLTATPIPRTLQMAVLGIKNMSLIETPPKNRKSVVTYVTGYDERLIRDVVYKEVARGGQVFILYNKVSDIEEKVIKLRKIIPDVSFNFAHGQMDKNVFEDVMNSFIDGEFNVLVCTTIIETGVDIPNVNSLIVLDADRFGLSQLYQIRGRVGRSSNLAYAYLMYDKGKVLTENAVKRLNVIKNFTELGSGFAIAARDLSIRGAGDILGSEQAGFIDAVGIDLYLKMLNAEVARLNGGASVSDVEEVDNGEISKNVSSHIKDSYVEDEDIKIEIHKLINSIENEYDLEKIKSELEDRFGSVDNDLLIYMNEQLFDSLVNKLGIIKVYDNGIYREVIFDKERSSKFDYESLFMTSLKINSGFKFSYKNGMLQVVLYYAKCSDHLIFDFNRFLKELL